MNNDLTGNISDKIAKNVQPPTGVPIALNFGTSWHLYFHDEDLFIVDRLLSKIRSELGWFERISSHGPSVGEFYESLLKSTLRECLPTKFKIGSGFIYDSNRRITSPQIDIIVYKDDSIPPIYQRSEFVIVDSKSVVSCTEVKKTLTKANLKSVVRNYINYNLGTSPLAPRGIQYLNIFSFYSKISTANAIKTILEELANFLKLTKVETIGGSKGNIFIEHLVLPKIFFLDQSGYISTECTSVSTEKLKLTVTLFNSSQPGHSLGEYIVSARSYDSHQKLNEKNFLTHSVVNYETQDFKDEFCLWTRFTMEDLLELYPKEENLLISSKNDGVIKYGAMISSSITNLKDIRLQDLVLSKGFMWLTQKITKPNSN